MSNKPQDVESNQLDSSFIQFDDAKQKGAASAASTPRRKTLLGALTAVCIALIVVSLGFVHPSVSGAWSIDWIVELWVQGFGRIRLQGRFRVFGQEVRG